MENKEEMVEKSVSGLEKEPSLPAYPGTEGDEFPVVVQNEKGDNAWMVAELSKLKKRNKMLMSVIVMMLVFALVLMALWVVKHQMHHHGDQLVPR